MKRNQNNEAFASATASTATINRATPNMPNTQATIIPLSQYHSQEDITLTSMEVAEMIGKEHYNVMRDIRRHIKYINEHNKQLINELKNELVDSADDNNEFRIGFAGNKTTITAENFFKEAYYADSKGEIRPYFEVTKKGCDLLAHKMTGQKGTIFTALYVERFHYLEKQTNMQAFSNSLQFLVQAVSKIQSELTDLKNSQVATQPLLQTTVKPPTPRNTRWKSKTFKKLQLYIDYVNDKFGMSVKFNNAISSVLTKMNDDDCWDDCLDDCWEDNPWEDKGNICSVDSYISKYRNLFDLEEEPLILDVVEYFPELKKKFTDTLDNILEEYDLTSKCA